MPDEIKCGVSEQVEYLAFMVGGQKVWSTRQDAFVARLNKGDELFWRERGDTEWRFGFVQGTYHYDGLCVRVNDRTIFSDYAEIRIPDDWPPASLGIETRIPPTPKGGE